MLLAITVASIFYDRLVFRARKHLFKSREPLSDEELHFRYYSTSGYTPSETAQAWRVIARILLADAKTMRPTDRLAVEFAPTIWTDQADSETDDLFVFVGLACKIAEVKWEPTELLVIDDIVKLLCECQRKQPLPDLRRIGY